MRLAFVRVFIFGNTRTDSQTRSFNIIFNHHQLVFFSPMSVDLEASDSGAEDFLEAVLKERAEKKQRKQEEQEARIKARIPGVVEETNKRRDAGYKIMKNKGLTRIRKKENRNSRVKYRSKYEKAVMRRKGQVQDTIREGPSDGASYGGEESGIRTHLKKSIRIS